MLALHSYINYRLRVHRAQVRILTHDQITAYADWQPFGPHWLRSITGARYWDWGDQLVSFYVHDAGELRELPGKHSIKVLKLTGCDLAEFPDLDGFDKLVAVDNCFNAAQDEQEMQLCLRAIAKCRSLQGLNLYEARVTDRCLKELIPLQNLANLELAENEEITDRGLEHLKSLKSLKRLSLGRKSNYTQAAVDKLQAALPDCEIEW